jgi:hypothetical protein
MVKGLALMGNLSVPAPRVKVATQVCMFRVRKVAETSDLLPMSELSMALNVNSD